MLENPMYLADPPEPAPRFELLGRPRVESGYSDEWETVMICDIRRDDGVIADVWIVAGVPTSKRGSSAAAGRQRGYCDVRMFGDSAGHWCSPCFDADDADDIITACRTAALAAHLEATQAREG